MAGQTQEQYYNELVAQILGPNAWTPGRAMTQTEKLDPVLRQLIMERLRSTGRMPGMITGR